MINNNPDQVAIKYLCKADGAYLTPKGIAAGDPWPICTTKPVRPRKQSFYIHIYTNLSFNEFKIKSTA